VSKAHNAGRLLKFVKPLDSWMGGKALELLRMLRLKDTLAECMTNRVFWDNKQFHFLGEVLKIEEYWDLHFAVCQSLYPLYRLLRLADMKIRGINKVKYYVHQVDHLMEEGIQLVEEKWLNEDVAAKLNKHSKAVKGG